MPKKMKIILLLVIFTAVVTAAFSMSLRMNEPQEKQKTSRNAQPAAQTIDEKPSLVQAEEIPDEAEKPPMTEKEYAFLKTEMAKAIDRDRGIKVDDIAFKDNLIIITFANPDRFDLKSATVSSVYMLSLASAIVVQTKLKDRIDRVVLISKFKNGEALRISCDVHLMMAVAERQIPQEEILDYILIEPIEKDNAGEGQAVR